MDGLSLYQVFLRLTFTDYFFVAYIFSSLYLLHTLLRFAYVFLARQFGFYSPDHYGWWFRFPWRSVYRIYQSFMIWYWQVFKIGKHHTGGFSSPIASLTQLYKSGQLPLGRVTIAGIGLFQPIGVTIRRHLFILAMTGSTKTTSLITMLACWRGSAAIIDPKAQIVNTLALLDRLRKWFVIDPYGISNFKTACINFFDRIKNAASRDGPSAIVLWSQRLAEALIVTPSCSKSPYFYDTARQFLSGVIMHVISAHPEREHNLPFVRDLIVSGIELVDEDGKDIESNLTPYQVLMEAMSMNTAFDGAIQGAVSALKSAGSGDTGGAVWSTLQEQTKFLDIPIVRDILRISDFDFADLKRRDDIVVAFTAPIYSIREELSSFARLFTNFLAYSFEAEKKKKGQCLFICDELPSQKYNPTFEISLAISRSYGLSCVAIAQSIEQMRAVYPNSYKSFISEADATIWAGANHPDNNAMLSQILGKKTLIETDYYSGQTRYRDAPVMTPDQVAQYLDPDSNRLIVTRAGKKALKLRSDPYFKALPVWQYVGDPDHREYLLRRITRFILRIKT